MRCCKSKYQPPLTKRERAAVLRLYVRERLTVAKTAEQLQLTEYRVAQFLHSRGVVRPRGSGLKKFSPEGRRELESELATTTDVVLARKYGVSHVRIGEIRRQLGYPLSHTVRHQQALRAQAERREQKRLARALRQRQRAAAIDRLSERWRAGVPVSELAQEYGIRPVTMSWRISYYRRLSPEKFPYRGGMSWRAEDPQVRAKRREQRKRARELRRQRRLLAFEHLSERWKAGATALVLAREYGCTARNLRARVSSFRRRFPEKFPYRRNPGWLLQFAPVRAEPRESESLAGGHAQELRRTRRLQAIEHLSERWKAGATVPELAQECGVGCAVMHMRVCHLRKQFPGQFPRRLRPRSPRLPGTVVGQQP
jgi:hypothetical protein